MAPRQPGVCRVPVPGDVQLSPLPVPAVAAPRFPLCSLRLRRHETLGRDVASGASPGEMGKMAALKACGERGQGAACGDLHAGRGGGCRQLDAKQPVAKAADGWSVALPLTRACGAGGHHCSVPLWRQSVDIPSVKLRARQPPSVFPPSEQN